jgi:hypothetical protein
MAGRGTSNSISNNFSMVFDRSNTINVNNKKKVVQHTTSMLNPPTTKELKAFPNENNLGHFGVGIPEF